MQTNVQLAPFTTFGIGGAAEYFDQPATSDDLVSLLEWARDRSISVTLLGGGSNVLVADEGLEGLTILTRRLSVVEEVEEGLVECAPGVFLPHLAQLARQRGREGWEFMAVIPGTTGAASRINAGVGSGGQMADWVESVEVWEDGVRRRIGHEDLAYGYRYSALLESPRSIVTSVRLRLGPAEDPARIKERISALTARRRRKFPRNPRNCGSVFRSTEDGTPAGLLIDKAGLRGHRLGDCQVAEEHGNWILNLGEATAAEVKQLIGLIQASVEEKFGVRLQREVVYLPDDREGQNE